MCTLFHNWTKWEEYEQPKVIILEGKEYPCLKLMQKRVCKECGYTQRKEVNGF